MDIKTVAGCIPGVEEVREIDSENFFGVQRIKVGPISLRFEGRMTITERDKIAGRAAMRLEGADSRAEGRVRATIAMSVKELSTEASELRVTTDASVMGRLGEFGQPVMQKKANAMMSEFARNLGARLQTDSDASRHREAEGR
jgi:carbon monoxide dehydrogenase subunit G